MLARGKSHERLDGEAERGDIVARVALLEREIQSATSDDVRGGGRGGFGRDDSDPGGGRRERLPGEPDRTQESGPER